MVVDQIVQIYWAANYLKYNMWKVRIALYESLFMIFNILKIFYIKVTTCTKILR